VAADRGFKAAQKDFEPVAKAAAEASDKLKEAQAQVVNQAKAVKEAELILERSRTWSLYRGADLELGLDAQNAWPRPGPRRSTAAWPWTRAWAGWPCAR